MERKLLKEIKNAKSLIVTGILLFIAYLVLLVLFVNIDTKKENMELVMILGILGHGLVIYGLILYYINKNKLKNLK